ncbi:hypothetical protein Adu01nite_14540 [Paractinoplanes durhamensis]|uniref:Uncharacterized protein n=1 Tax=Paractinoplanes durhamensis TaxID=113563 RepID=A0ABQ3YRW0_9ACTN|nr:hypothetical protein [Actinoplanes durhamensis]GIE00104.1 hypothetical protein Adu01nite_14540 [Actinoplanes durhamensis]
MNDGRIPESAQVDGRAGHGRPGETGAEQEPVGDEQVSRNQLDIGTRAASAPATGRSRNPPAMARMSASGREDRPPRAKPPAVSCILKTELKVATSLPASAAGTAEVPGQADPPATTELNRR